MLLYIEYYRLAFSYFTSKGASAVLIVLKLFCGYFFVVFPCPGDDKQEFAP